MCCSAFKKLFYVLLFAPDAHNELHGQERYDARVEPHTHFICRRCARVIDLLELEDAISGMYGEIEHRFGCLPESHTLTVSGLCPNCRAAAD